MFKKLALLLLSNIFLYANSIATYSSNDILKIVFILLIVFLSSIFILKYKMQKHFNNKLEKEVKLRTENLNDFINASTDFVWEVDRNGVYTYVSDNVYEFLGYKPNEMVGKTPFDFMDKEKVTDIKEKFKEISHKQLPLKDFENWNIHKNGDRVLLLTSGIPFFKNDKFSGYRGMDKNITQIYETEKNYRTLLELASDAIIIIDLEGNIIEANNVFVQSMGYGIEEVLKLNIRELDLTIPKDEITSFLKEVSTSSKIFETRVLKKDGTIIDIEVNAKGIDIGGKKYIYASQRDYTEIKETQKLLEESKEHYKSLIEQSPYAIEVYDKNGLQIEVNKEHSKLWGFPSSKTLNKLNILKDENFKKTGLLSYVNRAYNGESVDISPYKFNPVLSTNVTDGIGLSKYIKTQIYPIKDLDNNIKNIVVTHIDVSSEYEAKKRESMLNSVFQVIPDLLFIMKEDGTIIEYRAQTNSNLYVEPKVFLGNRMQTLLPKKVSELFEINIKNLLEDDNLKVFQYELEIEGEIKYFEARMAKLPMDKNIMTIIRDVTNRVLNEQRLSFQSALLEQSLAATDVVDENGLFYYLNDAYLKTWGYDNKEEVLGTSPASHCADPSMVSTIIKKVEEENEGLFQFKAQKKDGTTFDALMAVKDIQYRGKKFYVGSSMDISKIVEQEDFIKAITETSPALIYVYDFDLDNIVYSNINGIHKLGYKNEDLYNMNKQLLNNIIHPEDMEKVREHQNKLLKANENDIFEIEYRMKSKDENYLTYHSYERPFLYTDDGTLKQKIGIAFDVSDLKEKEQNLLYQSRLAATGEMIDNIAHQWRQPLSAISTAATGAKIQKEMNCLSEEDLYSTFDVINDSAQYLSQTIEDFRDFFKPDKKRTEFYIENSINKLFSLVRSKLKNREIEVIKNIEEIEVNSFENELVQVLMNVVSNSIDALEESSLNKKYIFIDVYSEDEKVIILLKDNAGGVPEEIQDKIFESRFTTKTKGTGIGLYMSNNIIKSLNGTIEFINLEYTFNDIDYKGANFIITIPKH